MTQKIAKLPEILINQIAAGEVVENPASAIKELIENSIDAGATHIDLAIKSGGFLSILINDNGSGIPEDDVLVAFERHTTSKLKELTDLESHTKMGFRGEALASIASCSRVCIKTATHDASGILVELEGGQLVKKEKASLKKGTSIEIKDLFFNTPARKKFQKSASSSTQEIQKLIFTLILAHPKVSFRLKSDNQTLLDAPIDSSYDLKKAFKKRIYDLFSHLKVDQGTFIELSDPLVSVFGYIAPLESHIGNRKNQYFIVNSRPIEAPHFSYVIGEALKTFLPEKRFFQGVLHIEIDPKWVDINIHPQKKEVKFQEEGYIKDLLRRAVLPKMPEPKSFVPQAPTPIFNYEFQTKKAPIPEATIAHIPTYNYIKTCGYYPPYMIIDAKELVGLEGKRGLVLFDVKKAFIQTRLDTFLKEKKPLSSQGLLLAHDLSLSSEEKQNLKNCHTFCELFGFSISPDGILLAHPHDIESHKCKNLIIDLIQACQTNDPLDFIAKDFFDKLYQSKILSYEEAQKILSHHSENLIAHKAFFCFLSDTKIKELFYVSH